MGRELYEWSAVFRDRVDACVELAGADLGPAVRAALLAHPDDAGDFAAARASLDTMELAQPVLFTLEHALAGMWRALGVSPACVLGHSLGAYAAACEAGALSVGDALTLVVTRGRLLGSLPDGAMLAVSLSESDLESVLPDRLSIAAVNGAAQCVVSGPATAVAAFEEDLDGRGVESRRLRIVSAAHSALVDSVLGEFTDQVRHMELRAPTLPWISDTHGRVVEPDEARDPAYWTAHLRRTVRFADALSTVLDGADSVLLEVGPGRTLSTLARHHRAATGGRGALASLPHAVEQASARAALFDAAGGLWTRGVPLDWHQMHPARPRRVPLPTYPWQRRQHAPQPVERAPGRQTIPLAAPPARATVRPEPGGSAAPATRGTAAERALAAAFGEVLGLPEVGRCDNFFELGGDSLIAARLAGVIEREFGVAIPVRAILLSPSVAELLPRIEAEEPT
jgi:phthiocerol/phenolphthiocerol synthesis type-I polyketide synthase E